MTTKESAAFLARIDAATTHVAYVTHGYRTVITQTMGEVVSESETTIEIMSAADSRLIAIRREDLLVRKDDGRITKSEWDEIFRDHGHRQN